MNVLLVTAVYPPEPVVSARLSQDLRERLRELGHRVTVVCPRPSRLDANAANGSPDEEGVCRLDSYACRKSRLWGRARESWDFGRRAATWLRQAPAPRPDAVYANVWPLLAPLHLVRAARARGTPVVLHVQDVYPESLATKLPPWLYRLAAPPLKALDRAVLRRCASVVLISERLARHCGSTRGVEDRIRVVRNWVDAAPFLIGHDRAEVRAEYGLPPERFTFMYLGNLSALAGLDSALRAFAALPPGNQHLVVVGEGSQKTRCQNLARELCGDRVQFRSEPDPAKVARVQTAADAFLLPTRRGGALSSTPSKCISYMLSARPIVAAVDFESDVADDLRKARCAWLCAPEQVAGLTDALQAALRTAPDVRQTMGESGRDYARAHFSRESSLARLVAVVEDAARRPGLGAGP